MARLAYECSLDLRSSNSSDDSGTIKPFACNTDKYCLYCCCNPQCCLLVQRKPPRHFWEAWYFWLGIALLVLFLVSSISSYVVSNCRHSFQAIAFGQNVQTSDRRNGRTENVNEISINVIPTSGMLPSHRKMLLCAPQPSITHMTPVVA
ncbi:uncharacterized protein [Venturia canescens]|uniref:uncharacterized protein n=1 Tax=Venturia canescens TaxID=32260 RepID=UPI001C9C183D|nr:uncharacterized protein LOC122408566 [Venturia canescens]